MSTLVIGGEKGGVGKSTLACNLAAWLARRRRDVCLLDSDQQGTSAAWAGVRAARGDVDPVTWERCAGDELPQVIRTLADRHEHLIIDAAGRDSQELRYALCLADVLYTPLRPSQADLWTSSKMVAIVAAARAINERLTARFVLSLAPTNPRIKEIEDAREALGAAGELALSSIIIRERKAFRDSIWSGLGVVEMNDAKAALEIETLAREIYDGTVRHLAAA